MDPVSALIFAWICTHVIMRAAAEAAADQARAEIRRGRAAAATAVRARRSAIGTRAQRRLQAGRDAGPVYPMWWAWAAWRFAGWLLDMRRSGRQDPRTAEPRGLRGRPTTGPFGRVAGAAWRGGRFGWQETRRQWRGYRDAHRLVDEDDYPGGYVPPPRPRPRPVEVGVCEVCGAVVARAALAVATTRLGRRAKMCAQCRADAEASRQADQAAGPAVSEPAAPADDVADADVVVPALPASGGEPAGTGTPAPPSLAPGGGRPAVLCTRCQEPLTDGMSCVNHSCPLCPDYQGELAAEDCDLPGHFRIPATRWCRDCGSSLLPNTWWAVNATNQDVCLFCANGSHGPDGRQPARYAPGECRQRTPAELAAIGTPIDADGNPVPLPTRYWQALAGDAAAAAARGAYPEDSPAAAPAGAQAWNTAHEVPALPAPTTGDGDDMPLTGEVHTQADWDQQAGGIADQMGTIGESSENMLRCLTAKNAGREHMQLARGFADQVTTCMTRGREVIGEVNTRQDPYVAAVQGAGGSEEVADPDYYDEM